MKPLILDVDNSVGVLAGEVRLPLQDWQEAIRFGCTLKRYAAFRASVEKQLPQDYGTAFMGRTQKAELFPQVDMRNLLLVIGFCLADDFSCLNRNIRFIGFNQNLRHVFPAP